MTLTRLWTRWWSQDLTLTFAPTVLLLFNFLVLLVLFEILAGFLLEDEGRTGKGGRAVPRERRTRRTRRRHRQ